jgi:Fe-S-cluster-containing hydrogenase component 2
LKVNEMVKIDRELCIGCGSCVPYCPVEAIKLIDKKAEADLSRCVECGTCVRANPCPVGALSMPESLDELREISHFLSDPTTTKKATGVPGRGTEEVKTNDVTGRIKRGEVGVCIEMGRPGVSTSFRDVEKVSKALAKLDVHFEEKNPVTALIDVKTGKLMKEGLRDMRVLSCIIEIMTGIDRVPEVLKVLRKAEKEIDTVFSLGMICRFNEDGTIPVAEMLKAQGVKVRPNAKINVGIGKPLVEA